MLPENVIFYQFLIVGFLHHSHIPHLVCCRWSESVWRHLPQHGCIIVRLWQWNRYLFGVSLYVKDNFNPQMIQNWQLIFLFTCTVYISVELHCKTVINSKNVCIHILGPKLNLSQHFGIWMCVYKIHGHFSFPFCLTSYWQDFWWWSLKERNQNKFWETTKNHSNNEIRHICDERVCSTETSATALTPKHSSPHWVAKWGVSGFNGQVNRFENLNCRFGPQSLFAPTPSACGETGQGNGVRGSAYCSASFSTADYDHHECQALL